MKRTRIPFVLKALVSALLLAVLYSRIDLSRLAALAAGVRLLPLAAVFALLLFNTLISAAKWRLLLRSDGIELPFPSLFASYLCATFLNVFLPSNIGGDVYRIVDVSRRSTRPVNTFASVFADRFSGFLALSFLGFLFPLIGSGLVGAPVLVFVPLAIFAVLLALGGLLFHPACLRRLAGLLRMERAARLLEEFLGAMAAYRRHPRIVSRTMGISFVFQFTVIVCVWLLSEALRLDIPLAYFCIFVPLISLLEALPVSIYGLGVRDAGYVFFFSRIGRPGAEAASLALLYVTVSLAYAALGGIVFALRRHAAGEPT